MIWMPQNLPSSNISLAVMVAIRSSPEPRLLVLSPPCKHDLARKLHEHGVSWDIITSSTGIKHADLKKAAKAAPTSKLAKK